MTNREPTSTRKSQVQLPLHANIGIYLSSSIWIQARQTTEKFQTLLIACAKQLGWTEDHIIHLAQHEGMQTLLSLIERDEIKVVITINETFLFRDATPAQVKEFIRLSQEHQVIFLILERIYDFTNPMHISLFRAKSESWFRFLEEIQANQ
jgi:hypothetical protein